MNKNDNLIIIKTSSDPIPSAPPTSTPISEVGVIDVNIDLEVTESNTACNTNHIQVIYSPTNGNCF